MDMLSRKDLNSAELQTVRFSKNPITVSTANSEVQTKKGSNSVCQLIGFTRDSKAPRRYDGSSLTWFALRKSRILFEVSLKTYSASIPKSHNGYYSQWEVQTNEETTVYVKEFGLFLTVKLLDDTTAVHSPEKLCENHGSGQLPHLIQKTQGYSAIWETTCRPLSQDYRLVHLQVHLQLCYRRTQ